MKKKHLLILCCLLGSLFTAVQATTPVVDILGLRVSAKVDYSPVDDLHVFASEEFRLGGTDALDCSYTELGLSYNVCSFFKAGLSYTAILNFKGDESLPLNQMIYEVDFRHRGTLDLTFSLKSGQWKFSLRERVQATYRTKRPNIYQQSQTTWVLRNRLKVAYGPKKLPIEPYLYIEPRLLLNGASWASQGAMPSEFSTATFTGYKDLYFNRYRVSIGTEWQVTERNSMDFYLIYDYLRDAEISAYEPGHSQEGILKSPVTMANSHYVALGIAYQFSL